MIKSVNVHQDTDEKSIEELEMRLAIELENRLELTCKPDCSVYW